MKMKYFAAVALLLWLGVTGWLASMVIVKPAVLRVGHGVGETEAMTQLRLSISRNKQLQQSLESSDSYTGSAAAGPVVAIPDPTAVAQRDTPEDLPPPPSLAMVLTADGQRSAVVNGEHVRAGQRLLSGARVRAIGPDWVRVDDPVHGVQTLVVPGPARNTGKHK